MAIKIKAAALSLGLFFAIIHLIGVILIQVGGSALINWKLGLHFLSGVSYTVTAFGIGTLIIGLIAAFVVGAILGALFAWLYNLVE